MRMRWTGVLGVMMGAVVGCKPIQTHNTVVIEQPKPIDININLSGRVELVITDARRDLGEITGKEVKPVSPEDIGLPAEPPAPPRGKTGALAPLQEGMVLTLVSFPGAQPLARGDDLVTAMKNRHPQIRALLDKFALGEAHTGLVAERGTLSADERAVVAAENKDRAELYALRAQERGVTVETVALEYYRVHLGDAKKGQWYEKYDKATKQWTWARWQE